MALCSISCTNSRLATIRKKRRKARRETEWLFDVRSCITFGQFRDKYGWKVQVLCFSNFRFRWKFREISVNFEPSTSVSFRDVRYLFVYNLSIFVIRSVSSCFEYLSCFLVGGCSVPAPVHPQTLHQNATDTPRHFRGKPIDVLWNSHPFALRRSGRGN